MDNRAYLNFLKIHLIELYCIPVKLKNGLMIIYLSYKEYIEV